MFFFSLSYVLQSLYEVICCSVNFSCLQHELIATTLGFSHPQSVLYFSECQFSVVICISNYSDVEHVYFIVRSSSGNWVVKSKTKMIACYFQTNIEYSQEVINFFCGSVKISDASQKITYANRHNKDRKESCRYRLIFNHLNPKIGQQQSLLYPKIGNNKITVNSSQFCKPFAELILP